MNRSDLIFTIIKLPVDFLMLLVAGVVTYLLRTEIISGFRPVLFNVDLPMEQYTYIVILVSLIFLGVFALSGLYAHRPRLFPGEEFIKIVVASSAGIMGIIIYIFLRQELFNSRFLVLGGWVAAILFVFLGRMFIRFSQKIAASKFNYGIQRVLVIGQGEGANNISKALDDLEVGDRIVRKLQEPNLEELKKMIENSEIDKVILANTHYPPEQINELIDCCHENYITFRYVPDLHHTFTTNFDVDIVKGFPLIEIKRTALGGWGGVIKRVIDILFSILALVILSPLLLIISLAIKLDTKGPVFVKLQRVSQNKGFLLYKFRSMIAVDPDGSAHSLNPYYRSIANDRPEAGPLWKMKDDPRITRVGKITRKTRLDELAQLFNVLKGEMSLVGPRPHQPDEVARYERRHKKLLAIKAGATGLAQISGSSDIPFEEEVVLDSFYIDNWSLLLDIKIMLKTAFKMLNDRSAV